MRLTKSRDGDKYVLTFEVSAVEASAAVIDMHELWKSKKLTDFVDALVKMTTPKQEPGFTASFGGFKGSTYNTFDPFQQSNQPRGRRKFDEGMGSFSQEELRDFFRRQQQDFGRQQQNPFANAFNPEPAWAKTLGVKAYATKDEIKARYRTLAKENHPDRGGDAAKFAKITEAYEEGMRVR